MRRAGPRAAAGRAEAGGLERLRRGRGTGRKGRAARTARETEEQNRPFAGRQGAAPSAGAAGLAEREVYRNDTGGR